MDTREKVIEAAKEVFVNKGYGGARMQEIADLAGINKGLLHYYFKSKENLFRAVIIQAVNLIAPKLGHLMKSDKELRVKIREFIELYIDLLIQNPHLPMFVMAEISRHEGLFLRDLMKENEINPMKIMLQIQMEMEMGTIRRMNPLNLLMNILSMCIFPFIAKPIFMEATGINQEDFLKVMELRKKEVTEFVLNAIEPD
jgi:TetR/AcrR family transcriptional regulator